MVTIQMKHGNHNVGTKYIQLNNKIKGQNSFAEKYLRESLKKENVQDQK